MKYISSVVKSGFAGDFATNFQKNYVVAKSCVNPNWPNSGLFGQPDTMAIFLIYCLLTPIPTKLIIIISLLDFKPL